MTGCHTVAGPAKCILFASWYCTIRVAVPRKIPFCTDFHLLIQRQLSDNSPSNPLQPCTDTVERICFAFCGSRRVS